MCLETEMPDEFERDRTYGFQYIGRRIWNGESYFLLELGGRRTLPGYENDGFVFRVKPLPFQRNWDDARARNFGVIPCKVVGFNTDINGTDTAFPRLVQDESYIWPRLYPQNQKDVLRRFIVSYLPCEERPNGRIVPRCHYVLRGTYAEELLCPATVFPDGMQPGKDAEVQLYAYWNGNGMVFESDQSRQRRQESENRRREMPNIIRKWQTYEFVINTVDNDKMLLSVNGDLYDGLFPASIPPGMAVREGDAIRMTCHGYTPNGWPRLSREAPLVDGLDEVQLPGGQNETVEFKSSLVYPANGNGEPDVDKQLGEVIMKSCAAFMNKDGGCIYVGVNDDGTVTGMERDAERLNAASDDDFTYPASKDGVQRKIIETAKKHLGEAAAGLISVRFFRSTPPAGVAHLVCKIEISKNHNDIPVYVDDSKLFIRTASMSQSYEGEEAAKAILNRARQLWKNSGNGVADDEGSSTNSVVSTPVESILPESFEEVCADDSPIEAPENQDRVVFFLTLYRNGTIAKRGVETTGADVLICIPVRQAAMNENSRLLYCYASGHVNVLNPQRIGAKLTRERVYQNGWNSDDKLLGVAICNKDDFLLVRTHAVRRQGENAEDYVKATALENRTVHTTLSTHGNDFNGLNNCIAGNSWTIDYRVVPATHGNLINDWVTRQNHPGRKIAEVQNIWNAIENEFPALPIPG